jgi:hypothetical protein
VPGESDGPGIRCLNRIQRTMLSVSGLLTPHFDTAWLVASARVQSIRPPRRLASKQDAAINAVTGVRDEVITGGGLRRRRSSDDKASPREPESLKLGAAMSEAAQPPLHLRAAQSPLGA